VVDIDLRDAGTGVFHAVRRHESFTGPFISALYCTAHSMTFNYTRAALSRRRTKLLHSTTQFQQRYKLTTPPVSEMSQYLVVHISVYSVTSNAEIKIITIKYLRLALVSSAK